MKIMGHRGASAVAPENTMRAFREAWRTGADGIELDVQMSSDGEVVVFHDLHGKRLAGVDALVRGTTWAGLSGWRVEGEPVPRLADVLEEAPETSLTLVEIKCGVRIMPRLAEVLAARRASRVAFLAFDHEVAVMTRRCFPRHDVLVNIEANEGHRMDEWIDFALAEKLTGLSVGWSDRITGAWVDAVHRRNLSYATWTVNDPALALQARTWGIDLLMTDQPALIRERLAHG